MCVWGGGGGQQCSQGDRWEMMCAREEDSNNVNRETDTGYNLKENQEDLKTD